MPVIHIRAKRELIRSAVEKIQWPIIDTVPYVTFLSKKPVTLDLVSNHACVIKGEFRGSLYTKVDPLSLFLMLLLLLVIFTGSMWQCESTTWGTLKNTPSFKEEFSVLFTVPASSSPPEVSKDQPSCYIITFGLPCLGSNAECCVCSGHFVSMEWNVYRDLQAP